MIEKDIAEAIVVLDKFRADLPTLLEKLHAALGQAQADRHAIRVEGTDEFNRGFQGPL